ncbi:ROK family transcriptional regulator [Microbacterium betulae]|uniref:ROK family transcriptional regulator n=1 Tax=Microbacterium betulae TaxID=2981139 RepID=A0AA97FIR9_9MICO|nr:ROK family transcriptional regulator [Microbacterium sp. AB]WOF24008.1 ROK family transcriptional regulator [Microbacterium sp. AB]
MGASSALSRRARTGTRQLPEHARVHNRALVLTTLFHEGAMSRADLARETGLTRVTTSDLVAELVRDGLVLELGLRAPSGPGKPALLVDLDRTGLLVAGIDLSGADEYVGAVMDLTGAVRTRISSPRATGETSEEAQATVVSLARRLVEAPGGRLLGVGVASPGVVSADGVVLEAPNIGWNGVPLRELLERELGVVVSVGNDANAAALAEYTLGGGEPDLILVRIARGVGAGLLLRGELVAGRHEAAGEIGHVPVGSGGPECACGNRGCLEAWIAMPRLLEQLDGAPEPDAVLRDAGGRLGMALAPVVGALDVSDVVVAAPPELYDGVLLDAARDMLRERTLGRFRSRVRMRISEHNDDIVLRGALVMVLSTALGVS